MRCVIKFSFNSRVWLGNERYRTFFKVAFWFLFREETSGSTKSLWQSNCKTKEKQSYTSIVNDCRNSLFNIRHYRFSSSFNPNNAFSASNCCLLLQELRAPLQLAHNQQVVRRIHKKLQRGKRNSVENQDFRPHNSMGYNRDIRTFACSNLYRTSDFVSDSNCRQHPYSASSHLQEVLLTPKVSEFYLLQYPLELFLFQRRPSSIRIDFFHPLYCNR